VLAIPIATVHAGGSVQHGLSAAGGIYGFYKQCSAVDKRYPLGIMSKILLCVLMLLLAPLSAVGKGISYAVVSEHFLAIDERGEPWQLNAGNVVEIRHIDGATAHIRDDYPDRNYTIPISKLIRTTAFQRIKHLPRRCKVLLYGGMDGECPATLKVDGTISSCGAVKLVGSLYSDGTFVIGRWLNGVEVGIPLRRTELNRCEK